jgi:hypothetical protein
LSNSPKRHLTGRGRRFRLGIIRLFGRLSVIEVNEFKKIKSEPRGSCETTPGIDGGSEATSWSLQ